MGTSQQSRFAKLKRFQFSLRTMLVVTTALILLLVFWVIPSERQRIVVNQVHKLGGKWRFKNEIVEDWPLWTIGGTTGEKPLPAWYSHYFRNVDGVSLRWNSTATIDWNYLPKLKTLQLMECEITDKDAELVGKIDKLERISLDFSEVSDEGLFNITSRSPARSSALKELSIRKLSLRKNRGLGGLPARNLCEMNLRHPRWLSNLQKLERLKLDWCLIDNDIFQQVTLLKNLTYLNLSSTNLREIKSESLGNLQNLAVLNLANVYPSEDLLTHVVKLPKLERLDISHSQLGSNALAILAQSQTLQRLTWFDDFEPDFSEKVSKIPNLKLLRLIGTETGFSNGQKPELYEELKKEIKNRAPNIEITRGPEDFLDAD